MNDKHFRWLLIACCITIVSVAFIWRYPDATKAQETKDTKLGEYVYVDPRSIIHASRKCPKLNYKGWKSKRIKVEEMYFFYKDTPLRDISFCPYCVSDKDYESLILSFSSQLDKRGNDILEN